MPSVSGRQHRYMELMAHDADKAKAAGMPQKVAKDFVAADKAAGKHFPASRATRYAKPRKRKMDAANALTGSPLAGTGTGIEG